MERPSLLRADHQKGYRMSTPFPVKKTRCAIYTRKSSDDGLDQAFNSLDAQRQSGESYINSHAGEGWVCLPTRYDDGGFSGGNMERPGLRALLADIAAGRIDVVVCYKLDRFTRSIRDFAKIMEELDRKGVALVMVTQPINTGTSMGRLMVHVLMSFAQFERELTSERTRDKIKLSRQRGRWTGERPVLGYDFAGCKLELNEREAPLVRAIYGKYLELRSLRGVLQHLASREITNKEWVTRDGRAMGGKPFVLSGIAQTLANPLYIGKVPHGANLYDGQHPAIIDPEVFRRVQELLAENGRGGGGVARNRHSGLLKRILRCGCCGAAMLHTTTKKRGGTAYRYYICGMRQLHGSKRCKGGSVPAEQIEKFVLEKARAEFTGPQLTTLVLDAVRARCEGQLRTLEARASLLTTELMAFEEAERAGTPRSPREHSALRSQRAALGREIDVLRASTPDRQAVASGLRDFDSIWCGLSPNERATVIGLVVERVLYDPVANTIAIELRDHSAQQGEAA